MIYTIMKGQQKIFTFWSCLEKEFQYILLLKPAKVCKCVRPKTKFVNVLFILMSMSHQHAIIAVCIFYHFLPSCNDFVSTLGYVNCRWKSLNLYQSFVLNFQIFILVGSLRTIFKFQQYITVYEYDADSSFPY